MDTMLLHFTCCLALKILLFSFTTGSESNIIYRSQSLFTYKNTNVPSTKHVHVTNYIKRIQNEYKNWKNCPNKVTINLETVLHPFLNRPSFLLIDNYFNSDIVSTQTIPILLRKITPHIMNITRQDYDGKSKDFLSLGWSIFRNDVSEITLDSVLCTHSKFFIKSNYYGTDLCMDINFSSYVTHIKPWNFAAHISLL